MKFLSRKTFFIVIFTIVAFYFFIYKIILLEKQSKKNSHGVSSRSTMISIINAIELQGWDKSFIKNNNMLAIDNRGKKDNFKFISYKDKIPYVKNMKIEIQAFKRQGEKASILFVVQLSKNINVIKGLEIIISGTEERKISVRSFDEYTGKEEIFHLGRLTFPGHFFITISDKEISFFNYHDPNARNTIFTHNIFEKNDLLSPGILVDKDGIFEMSIFRIYSRKD